ncbi:MAG: hypothetical protein Q3999_02200 [Buchananella hordeovulneris]|nr:hypothetical protein [Buchananella hordeovulneris]
MQTASRYVRPALESDLPALAHLHAAYTSWLRCGAGAAWGLDDVTAGASSLPAGAVEASLAGLGAARAASDRGAHLLAAVEDERAVGFVLSVPVASPAQCEAQPQGLELASSATVELAFLVVSPAAGNGHAERLLAALTDVCLDEEHAALRAWAPTPDAGLTALLTDSGFAEAGVEVQLAGEEGSAPVAARMYVTTL